jgi:hypothetical protein
MGEWFGEARAALEGVKADRDGWRVLMEVAGRGIAALGAERFEEEALPYLEGIAARWEDDLRVSWHRYEEDADAADPRWALVRVFETSSPGMWAKARGGRLVHRVQMVGLEGVEPGALDALELVWSGPGMASWPAPGWRWVRRLMLTYDRYEPGDLPDLALGSRVEVLELREQPPQNRVVEWLERRRAMGSGRGVRELRLVGCELGEEGMLALGERGVLEGIEALSLERTRVGEEGLWMLVESGALAGVRRLSLRRLNALLDRGAEELAACGGLGRLEELDVSGCDLTSKGATALARAAWLGQLKVLDVRDNRIGPQGLSALRAAVAPGCEVLARGCWGDGFEGETRTLRVTADSVSPMMMREIVQVARAQRVEALYILPHRMETPALAVLLEAELEHVRRFGLKSVSFGELDVQALGEWRYVKRLVWLDLHGTLSLWHGKEEVQRAFYEMSGLELLALGGSSYRVPTTVPPGLHTLQLHDCRFEAQHLDGLVKAARQVKRLEIMGHKLSEAELERLRALSEAEIVG